MSLPSSFLGLDRRLTVRWSKPNIGVMVGGAAGWATGIGVGMGVVDGQVGAIMIMQRIQQGQNNYTTKTRL
jgi:hypothetical protein